MSPPLLLAGAAILVVSAFGAGWSVRDLIADRAEARAAARAAQDRLVARRALDRASETFEAERSVLDTQRPQVRTRIMEVYREAPLPADCAVRPDVLRLLEDVRARANAALAGQSGERVPDGAAGAGDRPRAGGLGG
ncbi:hypothetical protein [Rhizorhabdus sp. FW153]|uniref:hypothetical protein n=1 Tax=Rhizorhabdus sp. FW153 TaxID=3400216 RepID=UPI003CE9A1B4